MLRSAGSHLKQFRTKQGFLGQITRISSDHLQALHASTCQSGISQENKEMTMTRDPNIRTRKDGSIDTGYYMAKGRDLRSSKAHELLGRNTDRRHRAAPPRRASLFW
jgi:hypothetical protein